MSRRPVSGMALAAAILIPVHSSAQYWQIQTVESDGDVGRYTSLALDSGDDPHISYHDVTRDQLKYAHGYVSTGYWTRIFPTPTLGAGTWSSLALDSDGYPHISCYYYLDVTHSGLKYSWYDGDVWHTEDADSTLFAGQYGTSLAIDASSMPHVGYYLGVGGDLHYAWYGGSPWSTQAVDSAGDAGRHPSIALDSSNNPHVSYYANGDLFYASRNGSWGTPDVVDSSGTNQGAYTSLALDSNNNPHISTVPTLRS